MKTTIFITSLLLIIMIANLNAQWEILNEGISGTQNIDFVSENVGWIICLPRVYGWNVFGDNVLLKTEDGGISGQSIPVDENLSLYRCDFINELSGWAIGHSDYLSKDVILKTTDGGQNWSIIKEMSDDFDLISLQVLNDSTVFILGQHNGFGFIWKTSDGGSTWMDISPNLSILPNNIWFINSDTGILMCDKSIFRTSDGGASWKAKYFNLFDKIHDLQFSNDSSAFFLYDKNNNGQNEYLLCASSDTFKTWMIKTQSVMPIGPYFAFDENLIFAVMQDSTGQQLMKSTNAGVDWEQICLLNDNPEYENLYMSQTGLGILISRFDWSHNALWRSIDGGYSWKLTKFDYPLRDVCFIDQYTGYIVGRLFKTENGGETWNIIPGSQDYIFNSCQFINKNVGFTVTESGDIYKTDDGGDSWHSIFNVEEDSLLSSIEIGDVFFLDEFVGWVVGRFSMEDSSGAFISGTIDGGENWDIVFTHRDTETEEFSFNSINVIDNTVWAVGEYGLMAKYPGNNQWQLQTSITDLPLNNVFFSDEQRGWIAGGYSDDDNRYLILLKTNDGGETWQKIAGFDYDISDMYFKDNLHGWAIGSDISSSGIIYTEDGGYNWTFQIEGLNASLEALYFKDGFGWAVGGKGMILRTYDGTTWVNQNSGKKYPDKFTLSQNYPNPFNPKTVISWQLAVGSDVDLSIYNVLGQKVATLVHSKQKAGFYSVEWDASGFASGVYYYQVTAGEWQDVKKMVMLR